MNVAPKLVPSAGDDLQRRTDALVALIAQDSLDEILGRFESHLAPYFAIATLVMEASGHVVEGALPISLDLAAALADLEHEWRLVRAAIEERTHHLSQAGVR